MRQQKHDNGDNKRNRTGRSQRRASKISDADRRLRQADRLSRVLRVLQLIQSRGRYDAQAIAQELECSERTVYRDLTVLELAGVPWTYEKAERCYRVRIDFRFPTLNLTDDEVIGQATATVLTRTPGLDIDQGAKPTTHKLAATSERAAKLLDDAQQVVQVLDLKLADHSKHQDFIRTTQWALLQRRQLTGQYASPYEGQAVKLTLHPFRLCLVKSAWYLIARPADQEQPRTFRITRFKSLRGIDSPAVIPEDFDLKGYFGNAWAVYRGDRKYDVQVQFTKDAANIVTEVVWHHTQRIQRHKDGSVTLSFTVDGLNEIVRWVLSWGGRAKVLQPDELREMVVEQHRKAAEMNQ